MAQIFRLDVISLPVDLKTDIERSSHTYCKNVSRLSKDDRIVELNKVQEMFKKAVENTDNKVQIAMQMYEMVSQRLCILS